VPVLNEAIDRAAAQLAELSGLGGVLTVLAPQLANALVGMLAGAAALLIVRWVGPWVRRMRSRDPEGLVK